MQLLVVGGSDAGISAALRARELASGVDVCVVVADGFPNFSICGLPYFLSGETPDWRQLAHRSVADLEAEGLQLLLEHTAVAIAPDRHELRVRGNDGRERELHYDQLVIATGAEPIRPAVTGVDLPGVFPLHTMGDSFRVRDYLENAAVTETVIVGSGYIGLEMADALVRRGIGVRLFGRSPTLLPTVDASFGEQIAGELQSHGVEVSPGVEIDSVERAGDRLLVRGTGGATASADLVLMATGVRPNSGLGEAAGIATGSHGALRVDRRMATNIPDVYAAGDCVETWHRLLQAPIYLPLGTTAHKQGRVAGENAVGGEKLFEGSLGTQVVKVFDLAIARTGLRDDEARRAGFEPFTVESTAWDHKAYYPDAHVLRLRVTGDRRTHRLLGCQMLGAWQGEIAKRIDVYAAALHCGLRVEDLSDFDLSYTPPLGSPWDAVQVAAQGWEAACRAA